METKQEIYDALELYFSYISSFHIYSDGLIRFYIPEEYNIPEVDEIFEQNDIKFQIINITPGHEEIDEDNNVSYFNIVYLKIIILL